MTHDDVESVALRIWVTHSVLVGTVYALAHSLLLPAGINATW